MIGIPNVKLMVAFVFVAAFMFGVDVGVGVAVLTWTVYGFINPYGQAGLILLVFLITGECFYAIAGAALSRTHTAKALVASGGAYRRSGMIFGLVGLIATFGYDVLTNFATYLFVTSSLYQALVVGIITGAPFALLHEFSNLIFFATVAPGTIAAAKRFGWR